MLTFEACKQCYERKLCYVFSLNWFEQNSTRALLNLLFFQFLSCCGHIFNSLCYCNKLFTLFLLKYAINWLLIVFFQALGSLSRIIHYNLLSLHSSLLCKDVIHLHYLLFKLCSNFLSFLFFFLIISLYVFQEYKSISKMRLEHITQSPPNPSHFTVLVRAIPQSSQESYSDLVKFFFTNYHASSYLSHQMVYRSGRVQKLMVRTCFK